MPRNAPARRLPGPLAAGLAAMLLAPALRADGAYPGLRADFHLGTFDGATATGRLLAATREGESSVVVEYPGRYLAELRDLVLDGQRAVFVAWKDFPAGEVLYPELWIDSTQDEGPRRVWPRGAGALCWHRGRLAVRRMEGGHRLVVSRSLGEENQAGELLATRERYRLTAEGPRLERARLAPVTTPDQRLNLLADHLAFGRFEAMRQELRRLPRQPAGYLERAAVLLSYAPMDARAFEAAKQALDAIAMGEGPAAEGAARRLLEIAQAEAALRHAPDATPHDTPRPGGEVE